MGRNIRISVQHLFHSMLFENDVDDYYTEKIRLKIWDGTTQVVDETVNDSRFCDNVPEEERFFGMAVCIGNKGDALFIGGDAKDIDHFTLSVPTCDEMESIYKGLVPMDRYTEYVSGPGWKISHYKDPIEEETHIFNVFIDDEFQRISVQDLFQRQILDNPNEDDSFIVYGDAMEYV